MATTNLTAGQIGAHAISLVGSAVDTVTCVDVWDVVKIVNISGASPIYATTDGTAPTVAGANTYLVPGIAGASISVARGTTGSTTVKLISSGTPSYSVQRG